MTATLDEEVAELRRANAELQRRADEYRTERDEALEQQTATAEVLGVINSSPGDLTPVFEAVLDKATTLCDAAFGILWTCQNDRFYPVALNRVSEAFADFLREHQSQGFPGDRRSPAGLGAMLRGEPFVLLRDAADTDLYRSGKGGALNRAFVELGGARSGLIVPLRKDATVLGAIRLFRQEVRPFTERQIALLQNFAAQAVIAMENARLLTETREALEQQTATAEVLGVINSSPGDLAPVFDAMLEKAMHLCGAAFGGLWTFDGDRYVATTLRGVPDAYAEFLAANTMIPGPGSAPYRYLHGERSVIQNIDLAAEENYRQGDPQRLALVDLGGARTALQMPLYLEDRILGVITLYRKEVIPFTDKQIALLRNFAAQAVIAMENARLIAETREALEQQTATAEVLQVINSSPGDLTPVFDAILEKAHNLCGAAHGALVVREGDQFRGVAFQGMPDSLAAVFREPYGAWPGAPTDRFMRGERLIHIPDAATDSHLVPDSPRRRAASEAGWRTSLFVPLRRDDTLLGFITANRLGKHRTMSAYATV